MSYLGRIRTLWLGRGNGRGGVTTGNHIKKSPAAWADRLGRSEEHTSELQSQSNLVCRLLLEKKKTRPLDRARRAHAREAPLPAGSLLAWRRGGRGFRSLCVRSRLAPSHLVPPVSPSRRQRVV